MATSRILPRARVLGYRPIHLRGFTQNAAAEGQTEDKIAPAPQDVAEEEMSEQIYDGSSRGASKRRLDSRVSSPSPQEHTTAYVRVMGKGFSMPDMFMVVRAIERRYGRIREFDLFRDMEQQDIYQGFFWAAFREKESFMHATESSQSFKVSLPPRRPRQLGGIGLADLQSLMAPQDKDNTIDWNVVRSEAQQTSQKGARSVEVTIGRSRQVRHNATAEVPWQRASRNKKIATAHAFLDWGGFAKLNPISASPFTSASTSLTDAPPPPPVDRLPMRTMLTKWSAITGRHDPNIPRSDTSAELSSESTEPIPDPIREIEFDLPPAFKLPVSKEAQALPPLPPPSQPVPMAINRKQFIDQYVQERLRKATEKAILREGGVVQPKKTESQGVKAEATETSKVAENVQGDRLSPSPKHKRVKTNHAKSLTDNGSSQKPASIRQGGLRKTGSDAKSEAGAAQGSVTESMKQRLWSLIGGNKWS